MYRTLTLPKWNHLLVSLYKSQPHERYAERLNRRMRSSLTHLRELVRALESHRLIELYSEKKRKMLILTEKGRRVTNSTQSILSELRSLHS